MRVKYVPQRRDEEIAYIFDGERITATVDGQTDTFDFSGFPDGEAVEIISLLDPCPVLSAHRMNGEMHVTLLRVIGPRPSDPEELEAWKRLWTDDLEVTIGG